MPGVIKINPSVYSDKRDAAAVAWNEALRLFMEDEGFTPKFDVTPEQLELFKGTAYNPSGGAQGTTSDAARGGEVSMRAESREETLRRTFIPKAVMYARDAPPTTDEIIGVRASGNSVVDTVNRIVGAATTFGPAGAAVAGRGSMGGFTKAAGASRGAPGLRHEFEGREISKAQADRLAENTELAERIIASRPDFGQPKGFSYSPDRAYRRIGGLEGLRDLAGQGLMTTPVKDLPRTGITLTKQFYHPFLMTGRPDTGYRGPITIETEANAITDPSRFGFERKQKNPEGFIYAKGAGMEISSISRILHDDGTVIYSKARDGLPNFLPKVNEYLTRSGAAPVPFLGSEAAARAEAAAKRAEIQRQRISDALTRTSEGIK